MAKAPNHYNNLKREIRNKNILGTVCMLGVIVFAVIAFVLVKAGGVCQYVSDKSGEYSQRNFDRAEELHQQGEADKNQDNQEFKDELKRQKEVDLSESEVESDLEDSFVELTA